MNKKTLYHFILDKSSSMNDCRLQTIEGFNAQFETIKELQSEFAEQQFAISLTTFDNLADHVLCNANLSDFSPLNSKSYQPSGGTALLDAIGESVNMIRIVNESEIVSNQMSVVVVILTDGLENASRQFTFHQIARTIAELEATEKWTFTFLGADIDAMHTSKMLNIRSENVVSFNKGDMHNMMSDIGQGMRSYTYAKQNGNIKTDFLDFISNKDRRK